MSRFCEECGAPLEPNENFCSSCGARTSSGSDDWQPVQKDETIQEMFLTSDGRL